MHRLLSTHPQISAHVNMNPYSTYVGVDAWQICRRECIAKIPIALIVACSITLMSVSSATRQNSQSYTEEA